MNASFSVTPSQGNTPNQASISLRHVYKDLEHFLECELSVERLNKISKYLWIAGSGKQWYRNEKDRTLHANACGFLKSYTQLIVHESDFRIAKDIMLIPEELSWDEWRHYSAEVDKYIHERTHEGRLQLNPRYRFGELRIQRLNFIYKLRMKESPLQTALASDNAGANSSLHLTAYWFGVVVLLAVGGGTVALGALFFMMFFDNLVFAVKGGNKKPPRPIFCSSNLPPIYVYVKE
ncbi:hypothetical protein DFP73DRAFT_524651 [Morchella snyderi]|nr:hypothetical protein DFP73DRAFT_524651 [Morchella snyderi]